MISSTRRTLNVTKIVTPLNGTRQTRQIVTWQFDGRLNQMRSSAAICSKFTLIVFYHFLNLASLFRFLIFFSHLFSNWFDLEDLENYYFDLHKANKYTHRKISGWKKGLGKNYKRNLITYLKRKTISTEDRIEILLIISWCFAFLFLRICIILGDDNFP